MKEYKEHICWCTKILIKLLNRDVDGNAKYNLFDVVTFFSMFSIYREKQFLSVLFPCVLFWVNPLTAELNFHKPFLVVLIKTRLDF